MNIALYAALFGTLILIGASLFARRCKKKKILHYRRITFSLQTGGALALLFSFQRFTLFHLADMENTFWFQFFSTLCEILWWIIPGRAVTIFIKEYLFEKTEQNTGRRIANVIRNFIIALLNTVIVCAVLAFVFKMDISSILATGGISAMIIGLAIQLNLSNIFSGISLNIEHPIEVGDWVKIGKYPEGVVETFTWRTVRLTTRDGNILSIPNRIVSKSAILNYSQPDSRCELSISVDIDKNYPFEQVEHTLLSALLSTKAVLKTPGPSVRFSGFTSWSARYHGAFFIEDYKNKAPFLQDAQENIKKHLDLAGILPAVKKQWITIDPKRKKPPSDVLTQRVNILQTLEIFNPFPEEQRRVIAEKMKVLSFAPQEKIVTQGDPGDSLFIIKEGCAGVFIKDEMEGPTRIDTLGAGTFFGETALLAGAERNASIITDTHSRVYEITKNDIYPFIKSNKKILHALTRVLADRKANIQHSKKRAKKKSEAEKGVFGSIFKMLHEFFK